MMNAKSIMQSACAFFVAAAATPLLAATATSQTASIGLTSTRDGGIVSIMTDPTLSEGRLVMKVAAHNPTAQPVQLQAGNVHVFTAAGKSVPLMTLDQLIAEVSGQSGSRSGGAHQSSNYSRPTTTTTRTGELDVTGVTGSSDTVGRSVPSRVPEQAAPDPAVQQQIDALSAAILGSLTIQAGQADGAQVVTQKLKFSRKEEKALRVVVDFNGEQHEFNFEAPPAK